MEESAIQRDMVESVYCCCFYELTSWCTHAAVALRV